MSSGSLILGILNGVTFGLLAVGLVLVYKSNRFLNLAHAQMGALSAQILSKLVIDDGWNWWAALAVCVPLGILVGLAVDRFVIRAVRERTTSAASLLLVSLGVTQVLIAAAFLTALQANPNKLAIQGYPLPFNAHIRIGGVVLNGADLLTAIAVPVIVAALGLFLRYTVLGKSIRAAASNRDAARLCGISARYVSAVTWALAGGLSALTAILQAPNQSVSATATLGPYLLFLALGAAALAAFTSIPLALVGGVVIGVVDQLTLAATSSSSDADVAVFVVVVIIVIVRGKAIGHVFATTGAAVAERPPLQATLAALEVGWIRHRRSLGLGIAAIVALLLPLLPALSSESHRYQLALVAVYALTALSLTVSIGWAGQISLGQFALVGAGAFVAGRLLMHGWSLLFVIVPAGLVGALIMVAIGMPALRVPGLTLTLTTLGFAIIGPEWLFRQGWFGTTQTVGLSLTPPSLGRDLGHPAGELVVYYFGAVLVFGTAFALSALRKSQTGRVIVAVRDNGAAAASFGVTSATVKLGALGVSGFLAATAGVVWADAWRNVAQLQFPPEASLTVLAPVIIGGAGSISGAVAAAGLFFGITFFVAPHVDPLFGSVGSSIAFQLLLAGVSIIAVVRRFPAGLAGAARDWLQRRIDGISKPAVAEHRQADKPTLVAEDIAVRFGGVQALAGASIAVRPGEIVGLIGPNGAGKTTLINAISGNLEPDRGSVHIGPHELTNLAPELRSFFGLARSFQDARLFPGLTVTETLQVALYNRFRPGLVSSAFGAPWVRRAETEHRRTVAEITDKLGLTPWADRLTVELSTGTRRICDLAAQLTTRPSVLLLDEPTAGVAQRDAEAFGPLLRRIRDELDCSILIVEHDMPLLMGLCDRVYAMVAGEVIAEGTPEEIRDNPLVVASYLGSNHAAVARSGTGSNGERSPSATTRKRRTDQ